MIRPFIPVVQFIPAASDAIMTLKGFTVEYIVPMEDPKYMEARATIASYFAARKTGIRIG